MFEFILMCKLTKNIRLKFICTRYRMRINVARLITCRIKYEIQFNRDNVAWIIYNVDFLTKFILPHNYKVHESHVEHAVLPTINICYITISSVRMNRSFSSFLKKKKKTTFWNRGFNFYFFLCWGKEKREQKKLRP